MIYSNEAFEGGETRFDDIVIKANTGTALCFIHELKQEGYPVKNGIKYILRSDVMYGKIKVTSRCNKIRRSAPVNQQ